MDIKDIKQQSRLDVRGIVWFLAIAYGLMWLLALPMWLDGKGLNSPWSALILAMNFAPAIATFIVTRWISPISGVRKATGLRFGIKGSRWGWYYLFGWLAPIAFAMAAPFVAALFGLYKLDLSNFSGYQEAIRSAYGQSAQDLLAMGPIQVVVAFGLAFTLVYALLTTPFTFGEEWGWRGYLLPRLLPLGQWPALLFTGAIWGLWHSPIILLGFNYPQHPVLGIVLMMITCMIFGTILGWLRLATGSVWPSVLGHAAFNASAGAIFVFGKAGATYDTAIVGMLGWTGWILPLLFIGLLAFTRRLPVRLPSGLEPGAAETPAQAQVVGQMSA